MTQRRISIKGKVSRQKAEGSNGIFDRSKKLIDPFHTLGLSFGFVDQMPEMSNIRPERSNNFPSGGTNPLFCRLSLRTNTIA
jgi:hypothetical protein